MADQLITFCIFFILIFRMVAIVYNTKIVNEDSPSPHLN